MGNEPIKYAADVVAGSVTIAAMLDHLPAIAAGLGAVWWLIRIYETKTVQRWLRRWRRGGE